MATVTTERPEGEALAAALPEAPVVIGTPPAMLRDPRSQPLSPARMVAGGALQAIVPQTPEEYGRLATLLISAGCVPAGYEPTNVTDVQERYDRTRASLIIGMMKSVEIGVMPMTGISNIMIVNNRPTVWGDLAVALIQRSGMLERMTVEEVGTKAALGTDPGQWSRDYGYRVTMWRRGQAEPYVGEFTVDRARRAGLWMNAKKAPWINYPQDMLFNRARARASRAGFADCLYGLGIAEEERDLVDDSVTVDSASLLADDPEPVQLPAPAEDRDADDDAEDDADSGDGEATPADEIEHPAEEGVTSPEPTGQDAGSSPPDPASDPSPQDEPDPRATFAEKLIEQLASATSRRALAALRSDNRDAVAALPDELADRVRAADAAATNRLKPENR